jgi:hypothetical protein
MTGPIQRSIVDDDTTTLWQEGVGGVVQAAQREPRTTLREYLSVIRRRKWIILQVVFVPAAAVDAEVVR